MPSWLPEDKYNFQLTRHAILLIRRMSVMRIRSAGSCYGTHCTCTLSHWLCILDAKHIRVILTHIVLSLKFVNLKTILLWPFALPLFVRGSLPYTHTHTHTHTHTNIITVCKLLYNTRHSVYDSPKIRCPFTVNWIRKDCNQWYRRT